VGCSARRGRNVERGVAVPGKLGTSLMPGKLRKLNVELQRRES
jgi:hypothetical protein